MAHVENNKNKLRSARYAKPAIVTATAIVVAGGWEVLGRLVNPLFFAPLSAILAEFYKAAIDPRAKLWHGFVETLSILVPGFLIAAVAGVVIGVAMARRNLVFQILDPYVTILYNTPRVILIPILLLWLGTGDSMKIVIVVLAAVFPIIINTYAGVRDVSSNATEPARSFGASELQLLFKVVLPSSLPFIIAGIKLGLGRALTTVVVAEVFVSVSGLGGILYAAGSTYQVAKMFVPATILAAMGICLDLGLTRLERACLAWFGSGR